MGFKLLNIHSQIVYFTLRIISIYIYLTKTIQHEKF